MLKKIIVLLAGLTACGSSGGISTSAASSSSVSSSAAGNGEKLNVSVSFNAIKEFAEAVGKDKVEISTIIPDGMEPHDFEPKAQDLVALSSADVFIYNGLGMEAWAEKAITATDTPQAISRAMAKTCQRMRHRSRASLRSRARGFTSSSPEAGTCAH